ncbi:MAG: hypothetical protein ABI877_21755 [Gemmatimonadaceae bacterium]
MMQAATHVTIATSTGPLWIVLVTHFGAGLVAIVAGAVALTVGKGSRTHRRSGMVFVYAMIATGLVATGIAAYEGKVTLIVGGTFTAYLVFTAFTTVRPVLAERRELNIALMFVGFALALVELGFALVALDTPKKMIDGVPAPMVLFMGTIALLAAIGDVRMIRAGGITGARRVARHLWRMCFGLFIASGSFFLGQMKFLPQSLRIMPLVGALAVAPLIILLYWMWRVRLRRSLRGVMIAKAVNVREPE